MKIFMTKWFTRFARKQGIEDAALCDAVARANKGLIDADLGGGVIKQRIARRNEGKSGGFRSIIYGFPKSSRGNLREDEADVMLDYDEAALAKALGSGAIVEVVS